MSREEAIRAPGYHRQVGYRRVLQRLTGDQQRDAQLIGQFGVGFYSAFIVADRVEVLSRRAGAPARRPAYAGSRARLTASSPSRSQERRSAAPRVILHLKPDALEFADAWRLRALVRRYSDHIAFPVRLPKEGASLEYEAGQPGPGAVGAAAHRNQRRRLPRLLPPYQ